MTDKPQPDKFDWATELSDAQGHVTLSKQEAKEIGARLRRHHAELETLTLYKNLADEYGLSIFPDIAEMTAELETLRAKIKTYEDLGGAADDMQLLRMGYAAARLEIESLRKEHADELAVAYMCGASREKELAASQQAVQEPAYPSLPPADEVVHPRTSEPYALWGLMKLMDYAKAYHAANAPQPSPAAQVDALDAARYHYLRDVPMERWPAELLTAIRLQQNAKWDAAIDAARAAQEGKSHDN